MTRYIDAGKLEHYTSCVKLPGSLTEVLVIDIEDYENIPEEDVEPVVRCKDCIHHRNCEIENIGMFGDTGYCALGVGVRGE